MNKQREEIISAALDGEAVELGDLRHALSLEEGRELLASFVLLRAELAADNILPTRLPQAADLNGARCQPVEVDLHPPGIKAKPGPRVLHWLRTGPRVSLGLAASIAMLAMAGAFWGGIVWRANVGSQSAVQTAQSSPKVPVATPGAPSNISIPVPQEQKTSEPKASSAGQHEDIKSSGQKTIQMEPPKPTQVLRFIPGTDWNIGS